MFMFSDDHGEQTPYNKKKKKIVSRRSIMAPQLLAVLLSYSPDSSSTHMAPCLE